jgi:hypothetical protein
MDERVVPVQIMRALHDDEVGIDSANLALEPRDELVHRNVLDARLGLARWKHDARPELRGACRALGSALDIAVGNRRDDDRAARAPGDELGHQTSGTDLDIIGVRAERDRTAYVVEFHDSWTPRIIDRLIVRERASSMQRSCGINAVCGTSRSNRCFPSASRCFSIRLAATAS